MDELARDAIERDPLLLFSLYTPIQVAALKKKREKLRGISDLWERDSDGHQTIVDFGEYYEEFWFWLLGAYEVLRTMKANKVCFCDELHQPLLAIERKLKQLRVPFAKQQLANGRGPIFGEPSVAGIGKGFQFQVLNTIYDTEELMEEATTFFSSIRPEHVLSRLPERLPYEEDSRPQQA